MLLLRIPKHISRQFLVIMTSVLLCGGLAVSCGSSKKTVVTTSGQSVKKEDKAPATPAAPVITGDEPGGIAKALIVEARGWIGTPYRYGGKDKNGADCSGFIMQVFKNAAGLSLPRSSADQCKFCQPVDRAELRVGDLVFFSSNASNGKIAHVGMYIGNETMIHASSSRGVTESSLNANYYVSHYLMSGRVPGLYDIETIETVVEDIPIEIATETTVIPEVQNPPPTPEAVVKNAFKNK